MVQVSQTYGILGDFSQKTLQDIALQEKKARSIYKRNSKNKPIHYQTYKKLARFYDKTTRLFLIPKLISDTTLVKKWGLINLTYYDAMRLGVARIPTKQQAEIKQKYETAKEKALTTCRKNKTNYCSEIKRFSLQAEKYYTKALKSITTLTTFVQQRTKQIKKLSRQLTSDGSLLFYSSSWKNPTKWKRFFPKVFPTTHPFGIRLYKKKNSVESKGQLIFIEEVRCLTHQEKKTIDMPNCFVVTKGHHKWYFAVSTARDRDIWIQIFQFISTPMLEISEWGYGPFYEKHLILKSIADNRQILFKTAQDKQEREKWRTKAIHAYQNLEKIATTRPQRQNAGKMLKQLKDR
jgi:hypothetical protein